MNVKFVTVERYSIQERKIVQDFQYIKIFKQYGVLGLWLTN
jgi:hypothetical protein